MSPSNQAGFAAALLDAGQPVPPGLRAWNGSDPVRRFGVYRNNVIVSLVEALGDTFPVVKQLVGDEFFAAMAGVFVRAHPPTSPVLAQYGAGFADWLEAFAPAQAVPYLPAMARLEFARVQAWHAADAAPLPAEAIARRCADAATLSASRPGLHPSLQVIRAHHDVQTLWAAHQHEGEWPAFELERPCAMLVLRDPTDEVLVIGVDAASAAFIEALCRGASLADGLHAAPQADLSAALALLIRHGALVAWTDPETSA